ARHGEARVVDVVEPAVPGLGGHREQPFLRHHRVVRHGPGDDPGVRDADRVGVGDGHRAVERAGLVDPGDPGHLAVAVLGVEAGGYRVAGTFRAARVDGGDAG